MCIGCWEQFGKPEINNAAVRRAAKLVKPVYDASCVGGNLHIQLDDWNIGDCFFEGTFEAIEKYHHIGDESDPDALRAEKKCYEAFQKLTLAERASALKLANESY